MKLLLFILLYMFAGVSFAGSYIATDSMAVAPLDTIIICDTLLVQGDTSDADHSDALRNKFSEDYRAFFNLTKSFKFSAETHHQPLHFYHIRAPPFTA